MRAGPEKDGGQGRKRRRAGRGGAEDGRQGHPADETYVSHEVIVGDHADVVVQEDVATEDQDVD